MCKAQKSKNAFNSGGTQSQLQSVNHIMGDQLNHYDSNFSVQANTYHQAQYNLMYVPKAINQPINQNVHPYLNHNNIPPHTFSPGPHGYNTQSHGVGHIGQTQGQGQPQGLMTQPNHIIYMQQSQQNQPPSQNQQQGNGNNSSVSKNSIDGMSGARIPQQHDNSGQQNQNKSMNGVRINHGVSSFPHISQPSHQQNLISNGSHTAINSSPPRHNQVMKSSRQQKQQYQQSSGQPSNQQQQQLQQLQQQDSQYSNEENQDVLSHMSNTNNNITAIKPLLEHLELSHFKVEACTNQNSHNHKQCKYYHTNKDRRREGVNYTSDLCINPQNCPDGDMCQKAHNKVEELYCPDKYKTKFCTCYPNNCHNCEYGSYCSFAHAESDIKIDLIENYQFDEDFYVFYYKTVWCPFNFIKHDKAQCVYSHNWQDYRRRPQDYNYDPVSCSNWKPGNYITKYEEGCPNRFDCNKCHGWKESEYHPRNYRTKQCTLTTNNEKCNKGPQCPYYHNASEKRNVPQNIQEGLFKYRPRNRNVRGIYKQQQGQTPNDSQPFTSARINQLNSTQSLPDNNSNLQTFGSKHYTNCQSPTIIQQDPQINQNLNGKQNIPTTNKKPIKLNTTSQLEFPNKKNSILGNEENNYFELGHKFNDEQCESIQGIMSENKWNQINTNPTNTILENQQQVYKIFQNTQQRINNTRSFDNFNIESQYPNNNQYFPNPPNTFQNNLHQAGAQINPEINEITQQVGQFSLYHYDNSESDNI